MAEVLVVDPVMLPDGVDRLIAAWEGFGVYTPSGTGSFARKRRRKQGELAAASSPAVPGSAHKAQQQHPRHGFAPGLDQRIDARLNYLQHGGLRRDFDDPLLAARHRYFRETLVDGDEIFAPRAKGFLNNRPLLRTARRLFGLELVVPWNLYANVMLPGQELGMHTDTPEFRGAHRDFLPAWLLCAMHLSGLFEPWRVKIATGVTYLLGSEAGGAFLCYPNGPDAAPVRFPARHNTALVLDTDSIFHGVERVPGDSDAISYIDADTRLVRQVDGRWSLRCGERAHLKEVASYSSEELRVSISWKAYCFADERERAARTSPEDALNTDRIVGMLTDELVSRGRLGGPDHRLSEEDLGLLIIDEFIRFPPATPPEESVDSVPASQS